MKANIKHIIYKIVLLTTLAMTLSGCAGVKKLKEMKVVSYKIESIKPHGLRNYTAIISAKIDNPGTKLDVYDVWAEINKDGQMICKITSEGFGLAPNCVDTYKIPVNLEVSNNVTILGLGILLGKGMVGCDISYFAKLKAKGFAPVKMKGQNIPISELKTKFGI